MSEQGNNTQYDTLVRDLRKLVGEDQLALNEPMSAHTTFFVGGPADVFVSPTSVVQLEQLVQCCKQAAVAYGVIGKGSNLLVSDAGYRGVVICTDALTQAYSVSALTIRAEAGVLLKDLADMACELGLSGLEFASGIPGSVGGATFMNAGAYDGQIADVVSSVHVLMPDGTSCDFAADELEAGYRTTKLKTDGLICLWTDFSFQAGNTEQIRAKQDELEKRRAAKQPLELPSAGSTFKRPEGYFAGKLIADAGLRGKRLGGAQVSEKHCGFVVNSDNASAADIYALIQLVQAEVEAKFGVKLEPEVQLLGEFDQV